MSNWPQSVLSVLVLALYCLVNQAHAIDTPARQLIIIDPDTDTILVEKDADTAVPPASMSKLMTIYMVFEALKEGRITQNDKFYVSRRASKMGGSKMFTREGDNIRVIDLLRGIIIQSGNDACVVVAEGLAGTEENFAQKMNAKAKELGLTNSSFANSTGMPHPEHKMSVRDLVKLSEHLREDFPDYFPLFKEQEFTWEGIKQSNRNPLLGMNIGADGLKTGHTEEAGYCLSASAERDGRRIVMAFTGLNSKKQRAEVARMLTDYAFRSFVRTDAVKNGDVMLRAPVGEGIQPMVELGALQNVTLTIPTAQQDKLESFVEFNSPILAPIKRGDIVGQFTVKTSQKTYGQFPLVALEDVAQAGFYARIVERAWRFLGMSSSIEPKLAN
ncbi:MAG: D-alanyl-D-alanine carboxypeptidase family protein [Alphaproteobacteria bacterium]